MYAEIKWPLRQIKWRKQSREQCAYTSFGFWFFKSDTQEHAQAQNIWVNTKIAGTEFKWETDNSQLQLEILRLLSVTHIEQW